MNISRGGAIIAVMDSAESTRLGTFKLEVKSGKTYLLRILNAAMNEILFFAISNHKLTVVVTDGSYTKPLTKDFIAISPGQTLDCLLKANQEPNNLYYMAAKAYTNGTNVQFDNTTTTAIVKYEGNHKISSPISLPYLPSYYDTPSVVNFSGSLRSLASKNHPISIPINVKTRLVSVVSVNLSPCPINGTNVTTCQGPNGTRLYANMSNISFATPRYNILEVYYYHIKGVFETKFPSFLPYVFNYIDDVLPLGLELAEFGTQVKVLKYNTTVELVLQGTNVVTGLDHPMQLHGYSFYVVGLGFGNFDEKLDPKKYNLVDPPRSNTVAVPKSGLVAIRFRADNLGVWFMHCHIERHLTWGMKAVFMVKNGRRPEERIFSPPRDMPPC
ncbi:laccase-15-like [Lycium ferocissimum]|uniref:laccase-15-like n=1 Tax=Lycium ferocissimum TaxID=112874 RepID=UPI0028164FA8|nr:laccase-15-like [Lycium ferocissimum]